MRTNIEFSCHMPYDAVEDEGGEFIQLPGRTVAEAMVDILADLGCAVEAVESAGDHGWLFWFKFNSAAVSCEVTAIDGVVAQFVGPGGRLGKGRQPDPDYVEILDRFGAAIDADPRFGDLGWFNLDELTGEQRGARTPTGGYDATPCRRSFGPDASTTPVSGAHNVAPDDDWRIAGPIERLAARMFDHVVIVGGALLLLISLLRIPPPMPMTSGIDYNGYLLFFSVAFGGGIINALFMARISTTPGKWLCQMRVVRVDHEPFTGAAALKREAEAIVTGCGMFIPLLMPLTVALSAVRWIYFGATGWDRRRGTIVEQAPPSFRGAAATVLCLLSSLILFDRLFGTWGLPHEG